MTSDAHTVSRRADALSRQRILDAAIAILDEEGATGLTLRAVMARLSTGSGAIYHHVGNMDELRALAADAVLRRSLDDAPADLDPADALRDDAVRLFDAFIVHGWLAPQLARKPFQPAVLLLWTTIGRRLRRLGLSGRALSDSGATLSSYILGAAQQNALPRQSSTRAERAEFLATLAEQWRSVDSDPLVTEIADALSGHDDRRQFLAGVDLIVSGITRLATEVDEVDGVDVRPRSRQSRGSPLD